MATGDEDLMDAERRFSKSHFGKPDQDITENRNFLEQKRLEEALREAKPSVLKNVPPGGLFRSAPVQRSENDPKRTDFPLGSIRREAPQPSFPEETTTTTTSVSSSGQVTPFFVTQHAGTGLAFAGQTVLKIYPGKIASIVPTVAGVKLDNVPAPQQSIHGAVAPFSLFLRAQITVDTDNLFRSSISAVKVCTDNDPDVTPDITGSEIPELTIFWENSPLNTVGHFYIKLADITVNADHKVTKIIQWLFSSYSTFVATGSEAVIVV